MWCWSEGRNQYPVPCVCLGTSFDSSPTQVMIDPVVCEDGHSYERGALEAWLRNHDTSPMSNARLNSTMVVPNHALRNSIEAWRRVRGY